MRTTRGRGFRQPHQIVDLHRRRSEQRHDAGALVVGRLAVVRQDVAVWLARE
jgi:hypothetical protein